MRLMRGAPAFGFLLADHPPPVNRHSSLRQREGEECTYGKERNEMVGDAIENEQQRAGAGGKIKNTDGEDEAAPGNRKRLRQETIFGHRPAQPRKPDETRVGGE